MPVNSEKLPENFQQLSVKQLEKYGFRMYDRNVNPTLMLIPASIYDQIPDGTVLTSISGERRFKGSDYIDDDTRAGLLAYGILASVNEYTQQTQSKPSIPNPDKPPVSSRLAAILRRRHKR